MLTAARTRFDPGLAVRVNPSVLVFEYGEGVFGPEPEFRRLNAIRSSLRDPQCAGPDPVYAIAMDVGWDCDAAELARRMLLFGVVAYAAGRLGDEPVRSQGHVHAVAAHCGWSTPELFEIWEGRAIVYAQERATDDPGRCVAVTAGPGDHIVVPPGWAHCVINADSGARMVFGAWCDRQYGFVYDQVRAHKGLAWFPLLSARGEITWEANPAYRRSRLVRREARRYPELGVRDVPIYLQFVDSPESVQWVSDPARFRDRWEKFEP